MERVIKIVDYYQRVYNNHVLYDKHITRSSMCNNPWRCLTINQFGESYICRSPAWLPKSIGAVSEFSSLMELFNSHEARLIRSEILKGRYFYCNHKICSEFATTANLHVPDDNDLTPLIEYTDESIATELPVEIVFDFDYTCNFICKSCRLELINENVGNKAAENMQLVAKIKNIILKPYATTTVPTYFRWAGGEPFVSKAYLKLWEYMVLHVNNEYIHHIIHTNGSYIHKRIALLERLLPTVDTMRVSFDAGTEKTYAINRTNGNFNRLKDNSKILRELINTAGSKTIMQADFIVQANNYKEIPEFIALTKELGYDTVYIGRLWNWGTWTADEFAAIDVYSESHADNAEFVSIMEQYRNNNFVQCEIIR